MASQLKLLQEYLINKKYEQAIAKYSTLINQNYPKSVLEYYSSKFPFLLVDKRNKTRIYNPDNIGKQRQGFTSQTPLVSIIIVSYNSKDDLIDCLNAVIDQSYTNWELILIDNGIDGSDELTRSKIASAKIITCDNVGFAEANNIGLEYSNGELLLLLNPDAKLSKDCLKDLVFAGRQDRDVAAIVPKIYFYKQFIKMKIHNKGFKYSIDYKRLIGQLDYQKIFVLHGSLQKNQLIPDENGELLLDIAINPHCNVLSLSVAHEKFTKKYEHLEINFIGSSSLTQYLSMTQDKSSTLVGINIDKRIHSSSRYLINNAGSDFRSDGTPYDIGFGQEDNGQFNSKRYVNALCGCCALIRRDIFIKRKIFVSEFFAYFEDSELSYWINKNNLKILYTNTSVYHKHSTATQEYSLTWNILVSRSRNLYDYIKNHTEKDNSSNGEAYNNSINYEGISSKLSSKLIKFDDSILNNSIQDLVFDNRIAVGIYNSYWSSMGGGEKHALDFAVKFNQSKNTRVYLISEKDFSIPQLAEYFNLDLSNCQKIISGEITTALTRRFDIFINSTYRSNLISESPHSYYIVSFPHKNIDMKIMVSYIFLHNSVFTASWANKYWGEHQNKVIMPIQEFSSSKKLEVAQDKDKICLSVGRFNYMGHCKNQHLIIKAFNQAINKFDGGQEWQLIIVGSMDESSNSSVQHYRECQKIAGNKVKVIANISRNDLKNLYKKASVYIHATGMNVEVNQEPHLCEHFGITVFEALLNGCYPILHNSAGPKGQVAELSHSALYNNEKELTDIIENTINIFERDDIDNHKINIEIRKHSYNLLAKNKIEVDNLIRKSLNELAPLED